MTSELKTLSEAELDALTGRVEQAITDQLALSVADMQLLLSALQMLVEFQGKLTDRDVTLHKLRKLAGIVHSSERFKRAAEKPAAKAAQRTAPRAASSQTVPTEPVVHERCHHAIEGVKKGDPCPECARGKLYKYDPAVVLRVRGQAPLVSTQHILERLRCNACGAYFTAEAPADVVADGGLSQKYGYTARAIMAINKHFAGLPYYRQETLQQLFGFPVSASTLFDQNEALANSLYPVFKALCALSADAAHFHFDDTTHRILNQGTTEKPDRRTGRLKPRSGVYTSGLIATLDSGQQVILFQTNIGHAGEWLDEILAARDPTAPPPILMSDALSSNRTYQLSPERYHLTLCNAHARRRFFELLTLFPDKVPWVLEQYGNIWCHEATCVEQRTPPAERLAYHREHSLPVMARIKAWCETELSKGATETHSALGQAIQYFLNHYEGLTGFCRVAGAQLDNNLMERTLKLVIRGRKSALFFKTLAGASVADVLLSVIATAHQAGINPLDYLVALQRHESAVRQAPEQWLPWHYLSDATAECHDSAAADPASSAA